MQREKLVVDREPITVNGRHAIQYVPKLVNVTRQGVRDLNGPNGNGTAYNGRRDAKCLHKRDPQAVAKYTKPVLAVETKDGPMRGMIVTKYMSCCMVCDTELGLADAFG